LTAKSFTAPKNKMAEEKAAWEKAQVEAETLAQAVEEMKKITYQLTARVPFIKGQVKHLDYKIIDLLTELQTKELSLEQTTAANVDFQSQNTRLTKQIESTYLLFCHLSLMPSLIYY
jgi:hypothetical protein